MHARHLPTTEHTLDFGDDALRCREATFANISAGEPAFIGFHHVHHLSHKIPNYKLEQCHRENDLFSRARVITLWSSLKSVTYRLWDEEQRKLVSFRALRRARMPVEG